MSSENPESLGSMYGLHLEPHPQVSRECEAFEVQTDRAKCLMCNALVSKGLYPGHDDLIEQPAVQGLITELFLELSTELDNTVAIACPFPKEEICTLLKIQPRL